MSPLETLLAVASLALFDVWLFWFVWRGERERYERRALRDAMRQKGSRSRTYAEKFWEDKHGKDRARHP